MAKIVVYPFDDGVLRCGCNCGSRCPLGKTGMEMCCTEEELIEAGYTTLRSRVGKANPQGQLTTAKYIGNIKRLKGKTALINIASHYLRVQFTDKDTGYGYGWHIFPKDTFEVANDDRNEDIGRTEV